MFHPKGPSLGELLVQGFSSLERGYDLLAPKFDFTPFRTPDEVIDSVGIQLGPDRSVDVGLDLCCGTGAGMKMLRPLCRRQVIGVDLSRGMLEQARALFAGDAAVTLVQGNVLALPLEDASVDVATCFGALGHIAKEEELPFVREAARVLKPGGRFVFVTTDRLSPFDPARWIAHGFNAGWRLRNALFKPKFVMYYLNFLAPEVKQLLEREGFSVELRTGIFPPRFKRLVLVIATKKL